MPDTDRMNHLHLPPATLDLLADLLHRSSTDPPSPVLPPGSRTTSALNRAVQAWRATRRDAENALHAHLTDVRSVALRSFAHDAETARRLREVMR